MLQAALEAAAFPNRKDRTASQPCTHAPPQPEKPQDMSHERLDLLAQVLAVRQVRIDVEVAVH